jgi:hypothetical protein
MGRNRPSNRDAPRVPGEEGGGTPWGKIIAALIGLLLLALLIPLACQALRGSGDEGSGAQGGSDAEEQRNAQGAGGAQGDGSGGEGSGDDGSGGGAAGESTGAQNAGREVTGDLAGLESRSGDGTSVTIPAATISGADGWIAVHADDNGEPGAVLGHAPIQEGENTSVEVPLDEPLDSSGNLYAMLHVDDPADGNYTFPDGDPPVDAEGEIALEPFRYTVSDPASGGQAGARGDELPESGGIPPTVVLALGAAMVLGGLGMFALLRRAGATGG